MAPGRIKYATLSFALWGLCVFLAFDARIATAQDIPTGAVITADYSTAAPFGATRTHTMANSGQGLGLSIRYYKGWVFWGASVSWQVFRDERQSPNTVTGAQFEARTSSLVPVLATGHYRWGHDKLSTFAGLGFGGMLFRQTMEQRATETVTSEWYLAASGDAGVAYRLTPDVALEGKARFVGGFKKGKAPPQMAQLSFGVTFIY